MCDLPRSIVVCLTITALIFVGCATIMHGTKQDVGISSAPTGAQVTIDNQPYGETPVVANLSRKDHHIVRIEMPGYAPSEITLTRSVSGWVWGNIIFGGLIGLGVDAISGGLYKLSPDQINATLSEEGVSLLSQEDALCVFVVLEPHPDWQEIGALRQP